MAWKHIIIGSLALTFTSAALAGEQVRSGKLRTLPHGDYHCSLPGDAGGAARVDLPKNRFTIDNASTYRTATGSGTYLLTGDQVVFTRGPMVGMRFAYTKTNTLQWINDEDEVGRMRCTRRRGSI